ncbi:MAG: phenylalanine--tRNA ligase subunit beta [Patescibacteria group bacterium]|jgi:phenylalanyl-tRNA synthetase beta chain
MLLSKKWLKDFVDLGDVNDKDLAERISDCTVEVEGIEGQAGPLERIVVGKILSVNPHPNADKLRVCEVDVGAQNFVPVQIVCGGSNLSDGQKVAVAMVGAKVKWHGEGEPVEIQPTKLRGVDSFGMICSANEIGLATGRESEREIVDLSYLEVEPGTALSEALGLDDAIIEVDNKSLTNRPDLFSHHGFAHEVAALLNTKFKPINPPAIKEGKGFDLSIKVAEPELCSRYIGVVIDGIKIAPSPDWLQKRLSAVGMRPINNVVDATNYVMLEVGQSLHAFDANKLENASGKEKTVEIVVKTAEAGEEFLTLDDEKRKLVSSDLLICDGRKAVTLAGIMGGQNSEIDDNTTTVFLESANFNSAGIRKTSQRLGLRSEASLRYEKSLDPNLSEIAIRRTVGLLLELIPGARVVSKVVDVKNFSLNQGPIVLPLAMVSAKLGLNIPTDEMIGILERLGFEVKKKGENLNVTIPTWRATKDISIAEDLLEEIARVYGYEKIPLTLPCVEITPPTKDSGRELERRVRHILADRFAATETYNYSFVAPQILEKMGEKLSDYLELANPISKERPYLARTLATNLLENIKTNQKFTDPVCLFEIGRHYVAELPGEDDGSSKALPRQDHWLGLAFSSKGDGKPFVEGRRMIVGLLEEFGFAVEVRPMTKGPVWTHPSRRAELYTRGEFIGCLTEAEPAIGRAIGLDWRAVVAEINLSLLSTLVPKQNKYEKIPEFPDVKRDLAFVVSTTTAYSTLEKIFIKTSKLLHTVELFDVYQGKGIDPDKKSVAVHLTFRAADRTLSSDEVEKDMEKLVTVIKDDFSGTIR